MVAGAEGAADGAADVEVLYFLKKLVYCLAGKFSILARPSCQRLKILLNKSWLSKVAELEVALADDFPEKHLANKTPTNKTSNKRKIKKNKIVLRQKKRPKGRKKFLIGLKLIFILIFFQ